jgi:hypothetical protein
MRHPKSRLAGAAAVAGAVCALAMAGSALAAPPPIWSKGATVVPGAFTDATPALAPIYVSNVRGTFVAWKGRDANVIYYRYLLNGHWSATGSIPHAKTDAAPSAAFYVNNATDPSEIVVWKGLKSHNLYYSDGELSGGKFAWTSVRNIAVKGDTAANSDEAPSVLIPLSPAGSNDAIIAWRGPGHHVRYQIGVQDGREFSFFHSQWISGGTKFKTTTTSNSPGLGEVLSSPSDNGKIYVFWKADGKDEAISYASTLDLFHGGLQISKSHTLTWRLLGGAHGAASTSGPAATSVDAHGFGPLMLAYKGPSGDRIRYQLLTSKGWTKYGFVTGADDTTVDGPALLNSTLASVSQSIDGFIFLHHYNG